MFFRNVRWYAVHAGTHLLKGGFVWINGISTGFPPIPGWWQFGRGWSRGQFFFWKQREALLWSTSLQCATRQQPRNEMFGLHMYIEFLVILYSKNTWLLHRSSNWLTRFQAWKKSIPGICPLGAAWVRYSEFTNVAHEDVGMTYPLSPQYCPGLVKYCNYITHHDLLNYFG